MPDRNMRLNEYLAVLAKVDAKFTEIHDRHANRFQCRLGCHTCCAPGLSVSRVEQARLADHIRTTPGLEQALRDLEREQPHADTRCNFLDAQGKCLVYEARPVICRSHGAPVRVTLQQVARLDVCPLNFAGVDLTTLAAGDCIDVETLNTILYVVNRRYDADGAGQRFALTVRGVLEP